MASKRGDGGGRGEGDRPDCLAKRVDGGSVESLRYYLSRKTVLEMLHDRGYDVPEKELGRSLAEFRSLFGEHPSLEQLRICVPLRSNPQKKILVVFLGPEKIGVNTIRAIYAQNGNDASLHGLMLILQSRMTHFAEKALKMLSLKVETFIITGLLVNVTKHVLQPKLEILSTEEKESLLKKYGLECRQLPLMLENDALTRYYRLEKGQVVKFIYNSRHDGPLETYRGVV